MSDRAGLPASCDEILPWAGNGKLNIAQGDTVLRGGKLVAVASIGQRDGPHGFRYVRVTYGDSPDGWEYAASDMVAVRRHATGLRAEPGIEEQ